MVARVAVEAVVDRDQTLGLLEVQGVWGVGKRRQASTCRYLGKPGGTVLGARLGFGWEGGFSNII